MSFESIKQLSDDFVRVIAALPPRCAVRLCLTGKCSLRVFGGYASSSRANRGRTIATISIAVLLFSFISSTALAQKKKRVPPGGRVAVVVEERLSPLRAAPDIRAKLVERLSRGHFVSIRGEKGTPDGLKVYRVALSSRTFGR